MFEINNTYRPFSASAGYTVSITRGVHSRVSGHQSSSNTAYKGIGQYRVIDSQFEAPRMAEIVELYDMRIGADNIYAEESSNQNIRRVGPGGHLPDPYLSPIGDVPLFLLLTLIIGYCCVIAYRLGGRAVRGERR